MTKKKIKINEKVSTCTITHKMSSFYYSNNNGILAETLHIHSKHYYIVNILYKK